MRHILTSWLAAVAFSALTGCGQMGPLYMPIEVADEVPATEAPAENAPVDSVPTEETEIELPQEPNPENGDD